MAVGGYMKFLFMFLLMGCTTTVNNTALQEQVTKLESRVNQLEYLTLSNNYLRITAECMLSAETCRGDSGSDEAKRKCDRQEERCIIDATEFWKKVKQAHNWD
jgi:hypothetical protein